MPFDSPSFDASPPPHFPPSSSFDDVSSPPSSSSPPLLSQHTSFWKPWLAFIIFLLLICILFWYLRRRKKAQLRMEREMDRNFKRLQKIVSTVNDKTLSDIQKLESCLKFDVDGFNPLKDGELESLVQAPKHFLTSSLGDAKRINTVDDIYLEPDFSRYTIDTPGENDLHFYLPSAQLVPYGRFISVVLSESGRLNRIHIMLDSPNSDLFTVDANPLSNNHSPSENVWTNQNPVFVMNQPIEHILIYSDGHSKWHLQINYEYSTTPSLNTA
jgi:hypothetical protein